MSVKTARNLFIGFSFKRYAGFYQQLLQGIGSRYSKESLSILGDRMVTLAEHAYMLRKMEIVEEVSEALNNFPLIQYQNIGLYYKALCIQRKKRFDEAINILESLSDRSPLKYRARAMLTLGAIEVSKGNLEESLAFRIEANRAGKQDLFTLTESQRAIAIVKSIKGNHKGALNDLESLFPQIRIIGSQYPSLYYDYLNSLAVELGEADMIEEAQNICKVVLASPMAFAYPEWRETGSDIALRGYKSRSVVSIELPFPDLENVIRLPIPEYKSRSVQTKPGRLLNYVEWIKKMVKEPNGNQKADKTSEELDEMTNKDLLVEILQRTSKKDMSERKLRKILEYVMEVELEPED